MKKRIALLLALTLCLGGMAGAAAAETYTASAQGFGGQVSVTLTIDGDKLIDVAVEGANETEGVGSRAIETLPAAMVAAGTVEVEAVSGATITSDAIKEAAAAALAQSGVSLTAQEVDLTQNMTPGTYYGEAYGKWKEGTIEGERFGSPAIITPTKVAVTVDETSILSVEVLETSDNAGFIDPVIEQIPAAIVADQSVAVDVVTGATMTSQAVLSGVSQALEQAGGNMVAFNIAKAHEPAPDEEFTCDTVVVGAGGAGTTAALRLVTQGQDVIILEKTGLVGGESTCSTGAMTYGSRRWIEEYGEENLVPYDELFQEMMNWTNWRADSTVVRSFLSNNGAAADFLQDHWDQTDNPGFGKLAPMDKNGMDTGKGVAKYTVLYDQFIIPQGGRLMLETTGEQLIVEDGAVKGVIATRKDGSKVTVYADNVILATGGYAGNKEMVEEYLHTDNYYLYGLSTNTGDGLRMALEAGATLCSELAPHLAEFCSNPNVDFYAGYMTFINYPGLRQGTGEGKRFYNEEYGAKEPLSIGASALYAQKYAYAIFTQADMDKMMEGGGAAMLSEEVRTEMNNYRARACVPFYTLEAEMQAAIDAGEGWKADTLEDLGAQIGFDPQVFSQTIASYKEAVASGVDTEFGKRPEMLFPIDEGPFYAVRICPAFDGTLNGIRVNSDMQALNADLEPIPGLYMGGYDAGGLWAHPYYQTTHTNAVTQGFALTSGYIAANHILSQAQ